MPSNKSMFLSLLLPALALCVPTKRAVCSYNAPGAGTFTHHATYSFDGDTLPAGLRPNTDTVGGTPFTRTYDPSLVSVSGGYLNLKVPGGQNTSPIRGAGVNTVTGDILYASVRTEAIFSSVPGTVQSFFFYKSDTAEIDLEYLSDPTSLSNPTNIPSLHYTNHGPIFPATTADGINPGNDILHEYRIDWLPGVTRFFIDGALQREFSQNVPNVPGTWIWNNWSNGDKGFSAGPPGRDSVMRIKSVDMFYNTTEAMC